MLTWEYRFINQFFSYFNFHILISTMELKLPYESLRFASHLQTNMGCFIIHTLYPDIKSEDLFSYDSMRIVEK